MIGILEQSLSPRFTMHWASPLHSVICRRLQVATVTSASVASPVEASQVIPRMAGEEEVQFIVTGSPNLTVASAGTSIRGQPVDFKQGDPELVQVTG